MSTPSLSARSRALVDSGRFTAAITAVILFGAVLVGLETYPSLVVRFGPLFTVLDRLILGVFIAELLLRFSAEGPTPWRFFKDGWNVFDFVIVAAAFVPGVGEYVLVARLLRLLRVLRLLSVVPDLQLILGALLRALPSMGYVMGFLTLLFYVYAVAGTFLFRANDPVHFGTLELSFLSLFRVLTLEDWTDIMYTQMYGCEAYGFGTFEELCTAPRAAPLLGAGYFVSFVLLGTMIFLNLFIGIIVNSMDEMRRQREAELARQTGAEESAEVHVVALEHKLAEMQTLLERLREETHV